MASPRTLLAYGFAVSLTMGLSNAWPQAPKGPAAADGDGPKAALTTVVPLNRGAARNLSALVGLRRYAWARVWETDHAEAGVSVKAAEGTTAGETSVLASRLEADGFGVFRPWGDAAPLQATPSETSSPAFHAAGSLVSTTTLAFSSGLKGELERVVASHLGTMGLSAQNLTTGEDVSVNGGERFPTASTIKLAVMATAFDRLASGSGPFKSYYDTRRYDASTSQSGAGFLKDYRDGTPVELKEMLHLMITVSDNVATNMLTEWMGGPKAVNAWLAAHGFEATRMNSTIGGSMVNDPALAKSWGIGVTTPDGMRRLMVSIATGKSGTTSTTDEMLRLLGHQYFDDGIAATVPPTVWVGSKSGALGSSRSDVAVVAAPSATYVVAVYTKGNLDRRWERGAQPEEAIREVGRLLWRRWGVAPPPLAAWTPPEGVEAF